MTLWPIRRQAGSVPGRDAAGPRSRRLSRSPASCRALASAGGISAVIAAVCYSSFLLSPWTHAAASASSSFISELEDPGQPFSWLYRSSDVLAGLGVLIAAWAAGRVMAGCRRAAAGLVLLALTGFSSLLDASTTMQCDPGTSARCADAEHTAGGLLGQLLVLHTDSGLLGFASSAAGAAILGAAMTGRWPGWSRLHLALGTCIASCGLADLILLLTGHSIGMTERARILLTSGWFLAIGLFLLQAGRRQAHDDSSPAPRPPATAGRQ